MLKKAVVAAAAVALVTMGLGGFGPSASAAPGQSVDCSSVKSKLKYTPTLTLSGVVLTKISVTGKLKGCTATGLPAGASIKGGSFTGTVQTTGQSSTCSAGDLLGVSGQNVTLTTKWKVKKGSIPATTVVFSGYEAGAVPGGLGFNLPNPNPGVDGDGNPVADGTSTVTGFGGGGQVTAVAALSSSEISKISKKCGNASKPGKGVKGFKFASGSLNGTAS